MRGHHGGYELGKAQLKSGQVAEAIESYVKANDRTDYIEVIQAAEREEICEDLVRYLMMVQKAAKDQLVDTELVYSYAKMERLGDMEELVSGTNTANARQVGDRVYEERVAIGPYRPPQSACGRCWH